MRVCDFVCMYVRTRACQTEEGRYFGMCVCVCVFVNICTHEQITDKVV